VKAAVIGCGSQGRGGHVANYAKMDEVELVPVCDVNLERAESVAREFNVPHIYADYTQRQLKLRFFFCDGPLACPILTLG